MNKRFAFVPATLWAILIFGLSVAPNDKMPKFSWTGILTIDKLGHLVFYFILSLLLIIGFRTLNKKQIFGMTIGVLSGLIASTFGGILEVVQYLFSPSRYFEVLDFIANIIGAFSAVLLYKFKQ